MSRTVSADLIAAIQSAARKPASYAIIRDTRIRFLDGTGHSAPWTQQANPWGRVDDSQYLGDSMVPMDSARWGDHLVRVAYDAVGGLWSNIISNPETASEWGTWTKICNSAASAMGSPGVCQSANGSFARAFFKGPSGNMYYVDLTNNSSPTWGSEVDTGIAFSGQVTFAPIDETTCYVAMPISNRVQYYRCYDDGGFTATEAPWRLYGNAAQTITDNSVSSSYFDAFTLSGSEDEFIVFTHFTGGQVYKARYRTGVWSTPQTLLPTYNDTTNQFDAYRVTVINNGTKEIAWLTGMIFRTLPTQTTQFEIYMRSEDGWNWSCMARNSFLCAAEVRGKLESFGNYFYYAGIYSVYRAAKVYEIDTDDPDGMKVTITDDLISGQVNFPSSNGAPEIDLDLAAGKNTYLAMSLANNVVKRGSEIWLYAGYWTSSGSPIYALLDRGNIDSVQADLANGQRSFTLRARDSAFKRANQWSSPLFWDYRSQLKHQGTDSLASADGYGEWTSSSAALVPGPWGPGGGDGSGGPTTPAASKNWVLAATSSYIGRSSNFLNSTPSWLTINGAITGTIYDFCFDPWDMPPWSHQNTALSVVYLTSSTGIWKTVNVKNTVPTWVCKLAAASFTYGTIDHFGAIRATVAQQDLFYVQAITTGGEMYVGVTNNGGLGWSWKDVGPMLSASDIQGLAVSQWNPGTVMVGAGHSLYRSVNYGHTFTLVETFSGVVRNIEIPYQGNASDLLFYVGA